MREAARRIERPLCLSSLQLTGGQQLVAHEAGRLAQVCRTDRQTLPVVRPRGLHQARVHRQLLVELLYLGLRLLVVADVGSGLGECGAGLGESTDGF